MDFAPRYQPTAAPRWGNMSFHSLARTELRIETWMMLGALAQSVLTVALPLRLALLPAAVLLLIKVADVYATKTGLKKNPHMDNVIMPKYSAQIPNKQGSFGNVPACESMAVLLIGVRNNSALGMLHPKWKDFGKYMGDMVKELQDHPELGFRGSSFWTGNERASNPTYMQVMYFKSAAHVHEYAHGELHKKAWSWWYSNTKDVKEFGIFHELYEVPSGNYESVYAQMQPVLMAQTQYPVVTKTEQGEKSEFLSPVVDARKGQLKTSKGRMARSQGSENDKYGHVDIYEHEEIKAEEGV